ncbi:pitrilysin family protein [Chelativorans sp. AA-79]|uniref:M16 family metallopeptidase n=1 Tax=Chelativorans sp. AA-79 TaxID=3028735 RepID=UPI0023F629D8|nr:pitrilysin family protein [Chelativorans sp. AA-79]WEX08429.1 pitrilysin family protein [Chelativorans sp. AA-79]
MRNERIMMAVAMKAPLRACLRAFSFGIVLFALVLPARANLDIAEVTSPKGIKAWLVEDQSDPIVAISFAFLGGSNQDPKGKEGLVELMTSLLDNGAGDLDSDRFQQRLYETGADLSFSTGPELVSGRLRMLAGETEEPLELLSLAVTAPRFDEEEFTRERALAISDVRSDSNDPDTRGRKALMATLYGDHPLGRPVEEETLAAVAREDLPAFHRKLFARSNLIVGVVGAIDPATLEGILDQVFGDLPEQADLADIPPPQLNFGEEVREAYDRPQTSITMVYPGVAATSPDVYPATLLAEILGGSGLSSRLFTELREKRGLTYGASADLDANPEWGDLVMDVATGSDRAQETLSTARDVIHQIVEQGPTPEELASAKKYAIGSYAISQLSSTSQIASTLVGLQRLGRGRDYVEKRVELFNEVTLDDVKGMADRLLSVEPTTLIVGPGPRAEN